ncbi:hypothetical protein [Trueperella sp. LYQ143]|uniref:hypothetical protein n=1 Tax=Trueperella sp. LYQ143 TaxID=3391059 RepID=UPI003983D8A4
MEWGSIAEWVGAITGTGLATASLIVALRANRHADAANTRADKMEELERQRDLLNIGSQLQVWWACHEASGEDSDDDNTEQSKKEWGIIIANTGDEALMLTKVEIEVVKQNFTPEEVSSEIVTWKYDALPPGVFFRQAYRKGYTNAIANLSNYRVILNSSKYRINSICYSTPNHRRWKWTPEYGLAEIIESDTSNNAS